MERILIDSLIRLDIFDREIWEKILSSLNKNERLHHSNTHLIPIYETLFKL